VTPTAPQAALANVTRQRFCAQAGLVLPQVVLGLHDHVNQALVQSRSLKDTQPAQDAQRDLTQHEQLWIENLRAALQRQALHHTDSPSPRMTEHLELLATDAVEDQLLTGKLATAIQDKAGQAWADLKLRLLFVSGRVDLLPNDVVRPDILAKTLFEEWVRAGLSRESWRHLCSPLHTQLADRMAGVYQEANRFLVTNGVMPEISPKHVVRKASSTDQPTVAARSTAFAPTAHLGAQQGTGTGAEWWTRTRQQTQEVMGKIRRLLGNAGVPEAAHSPSGAASEPAPSPMASPRLQTMLLDGQQWQGFAQVADAVDGMDAIGQAGLVAQMAQQLRQQTSTLKQATESASEKATIEVVALMFQSILSEDRIPPTLRVWFARLQIPVLRVALAEPDFFSSLQHPARRLIDRMGSCALGFDASLSEVSAHALEVEIRRIVQVIEQYPETGRRVFQLSFDEFQTFLSKHLQSHAQTGRLVSVAQQVEQKETLAVQYTIELRKLLNDMPVREGIRDFLFKIWAEVLAVTTVKHGAKHEEMLVLKRTASDLLWAASAKPSRAERAQVIAQLPALLAKLRKGMSTLGMDTSAQDAQLKVISDILAEAFMSRTESIPAEQLAAVTRNLARLEDYLTQEDMGDLELDQESIEMITGADASLIEIITQGGEPPQQAMRAWAMELQLGSWFQLDHNNQPTQVQLAWRSDRGQLCLFTNAHQRCYLFQTARVASYLQAGLLAPVEGESLTVRATRSALSKIEANPERLLS
jgi:hypothetical protein